MSVYLSLRWSIHCCEGTTSEGVKILEFTILRRRKKMFKFYSKISKKQINLLLVDVLIIWVSIKLEHVR